MIKLEKGPTRSFVIFVFCLAVCVISLVLLMNKGERYLAFIETGLAQTTNFILHVLGNQTHVIDQTIWSSTFYLEIVPACTGVYPLAAYLSAVIAYPSRFLAKLLGILLGIGGIFTLNTVRLVSLFYIGLHLPNFFEQAHLLVWQSLVIVFTLLLWLLWAEKVARAPRKA